MLSYSSCGASRVGSLAHPRPVGRGHLSCGGTQPISHVSSPQEWRISHKSQQQLWASYGT